MVVSTSFGSIVLFRLSSLLSILLLTPPPRHVALRPGKARTVLPSLARLLARFGRRFLLLLVLVVDDELQLFPLFFFRRVVQGRHYVLALTRLGLCLCRLLVLSLTLFRCLLLLVVLVLLVLLVLLLLLRLRSGCWRHRRSLCLVALLLNTTLLQAASANLFLLLGARLYGLVDGASLTHPKSQDRLVQTSIALLLLLALPLPLPLPVQR